MPLMKKLYEKVVAADGSVTFGELMRDSITASEAVTNDPDRYSFRPWPKVAPKLAAKAPAKKPAAAKKADKAKDAEKPAGEGGDKT